MTRYGFSEDGLLYIGAGDVRVSLADDEWLALFSFIEAIGDRPIPQLRNVLDAKKYREGPSEITIIPPEKVVGLPEFKSCQCGSGFYVTPKTLGQAECRDCARTRRIVTEVIHLDAVSAPLPWKDKP